MKSNLNNLDINSSSNQQHQPSKGISTGIFIGVLTGIFFSAIIASAAFYYAKQTRTNIISEISPTPEPISFYPTATPYQAQEITETKIDSGMGQITWLPTPQKISSLDIFKSQDNQSEFHPDQARFYEVASFSNNSKLINIFIPTDGMGTFDTLFRIIKSSDNISVIGNYALDYEIKNINKLFKSTIKISPFSIAQLSPPDYIYTKNNSLGNYKKSFETTKTFDSLKNPKLIEENANGTLYAVYTQESTLPDLYGRQIYLRLKDNTLVAYNPYYSFVSDNLIPNLYWSDGSQNKSAFDTAVRFGKCGTSNGQTIIKDSSNLIVNKIQTGNLFSQNSSNPKDAVYQIRDPSNSLIKLLYEQYQIGRSQSGNNQIVSIEEFTNKYAHFLWKDQLGDWQLFINQAYVALAECGKPVVYLYPQIDTKVNVQVAADISKSEPIYPQGGWTVTAHPDGNLEYYSKSYPYLYWEGVGKGYYPDYSRHGTLVTQATLISSLKTHLKQLGLTVKESSDFLDFWQSKLPNSPYVRLTWLTTKDMDILAPLTVSPSPDTKIRVFLEFEGLDKPIKLIPQKLSAPPRRGFTLVEWGGLLFK